LSIPCEVEKLDAFVQIRFVGLLVPLDLALAAMLFLPPLVRHLLEERRVYHPIELVDVHGVNAIVQPVVFGLMAPDRFFVVAALVGVAGEERSAMRSV
jgi:hypothetical protein